MPLFDYSCEDCGTKFERLVRREVDIAEVNCPSCGHDSVKRELSLPAAPISGPGPMPMACGAGPPCGTPWCQRTG